MELESLSPEPAFPPQEQYQQPEESTAVAASAHDMEDLEPEPLVLTETAMTTPPRNQDNTVLNAAAALLSIPSHLASYSSHKVPLMKQPRMKLQHYQNHYNHYGHQQEHETTALMDLVSPAVVFPLTATTMCHNEQQQDATSDGSAYYYEGTCSLSLPEDDDFLSPLHSFIRRYCVETFTATAQDANESQFGRSHGSRVVPGQVGIRCCFCASKQTPAANGSHHHDQNTRRERAVCFPSSLKNIYHSIETWQRRHSLVCQDIPTWVKHNMLELCNTSKSGAGGRRQYWEESARRIGLADTNHGIRFIRPPGDLGPPLLVTEEAAQAAAAAAAAASSNSLLAMTQPSILNFEPVASGIPVVCDEDKSLVKDYLYVLLDQMEQCYFSEEDRAGGRSKVKDCPIGFPGMQCKHCKGKAGFGRYFPGTLAALTSANSDRNIYNHIIKCRRCPQHVKDELTNLQQKHQTLKNRRGSRKLFFEKIWARLHGEALPEQHSAGSQLQQQRQEADQQQQSSPLVMPVPIKLSTHAL